MWGLIFWGLIGYLVTHEIIKSSSKYKRMKEEEEELKKNMKYWEEHPEEDPYYIKHPEKLKLKKELKSKEMLKLKNELKSKDDQFLEDYKQILEEESLNKKNKK